MEKAPHSCVDLIRHGRVQGGRRYRGWRDDPLSDSGWEQMWAAVEDGTEWDRIITSPLERCSAFARVLAARRGVPVVAEARFKELGFGVWEGLTPDEVRARDADALRHFYRDPLNHQPGNAEPIPEFCARVVAAWQELCEGEGADRTLLVTHAGVIRAIVAHLLQIPPERMFRIQVGYAARARICFPPERPATVLLNGAGFG